MWGKFICCNFVFHIAPYNVENFVISMVFVIGGSFKKVISAGNSLVGYVYLVKSVSRTFVNWFQYGFHVFLVGSWQGWESVAIFLDSTHLEVRKEILQSEAMEFGDWIYH